jgi:hypothetical protein
VANNFPVIPGTHVDGVAHVLTMTPVAAGGFNSPGGTMVMFNHGFDTGIQPDGTVGYSYDGFDLDALETGLRGVLATICGAAGQLVGIDPAAILAAMTVRREWSFATDTVMPDGQIGGWSWSDDMPTGG